MCDYSFNVFLQNLRQFGRRKIPIRQPFWILPMPYKCVAAYFQAMPICELHYLVSLRKVERVSLRMEHLPLERVFRFNHIELACQRACVRRLRELLRSYRSADQ